MACLRRTELHGAPDRSVVGGKFLKVSNFAVDATTPNKWRWQLDMLMTADQRSHNATVNNGDDERSSFDTLIRCDARCENTS